MDFPILKFDEPYKTYRYYPWAKDQLKDGVPLSELPGWEKS